MAGVCVTLWIGERLGPVERACLRSVLRHGERVALYCYAVPAGVPDGVELRDAGDILPQDGLHELCRGGAAMFSDWFRYALLRRGLGTWIDTDVYLLRPLVRKADYLFGEQEPGCLNNAVLRLPPDSPLLPELLALFEAPSIPSWLPLRTRWSSRLRSLFRGNVDPSVMPWGTTGPQALTALATAAGLASRAAPPDVFFPVHWRNAGWIRDPANSLERMISQRTVAVHLWNERIKGFKDEPAPPGTFLHRLQREGAQ
jgi:hypothetical protein